MKLINPYDPEHFSFKTFGTSREILILCWIILSTPLLRIKIPESSGSVHAVESVFWKMNRGTGILPILIPGNLQGDLPFNEVNSLLCSKDGLMWLGMLGGVFVL